MKLGWNWWFRTVLIGIPIRILVRVRVAGREYLPPVGRGCIFAFGSHTTEVESLAIPTYLFRYMIHFVAKAEYWQKGRLIRWFMTVTEQVPLERLDIHDRQKVSNVMLGLLATGKAVGVYPEATRSRDGKVHNARSTGVARTALAADVPILPVGLKGFERINPPGKLFRPGRAEMVIGPPIYPWLLRAEIEQEYPTLSDNARETMLAKRITDTMMRTIAELCDKEYDPKRLPINES